MSTHNTHDAVASRTCSTGAATAIALPGGLSRFDPATEQFTNYRNAPDNPASLGHHILSRINQDTSDMLWIGTYGGVLEIFTPATEVLTLYRNDTETLESLSNDRAGTVWIKGCGKNKLSQTTCLNARLRCCSSGYIIPAMRPSRRLEGRH